jgi:anti-sigma regulatory factor (Ser/Thr protein kinase)
MQGTQSRITVPAHRSHLAALRRSLMDICRDWGLDGLAALRFVLAVDEASANVIEHGLPAGDSPIEIVIDRNGGSITVEIIDGGKAFDPTRSAGFDPTSVTRRKRGFGLHLIHLIAETVEYERTADGKNKLTLTLPIA